MCNNSGLLGTLTLVKRVLLLIQIIVPIILIVFTIISFIKLLKNPEEKNGTKKIINQFIAASIVFFIPLLVDVVMNIAGDNTNFSSCWNSANDKITLNGGYIKFNEKERKKVTYDVTDYEKGKGELDFSCTSKIVKSQFSCETLKIVEEHLYDLYYTNFNDVINNKYGGKFENYAKSVGGIFGEYYGKKIEGRTVADFQRAAEYVLGWMYMYGWDYKNGGPGEGEHLPWGGRGNPYSKDAFYYYGGWERKFQDDPDIGPWDNSIGTDIDHIISGKNGGLGGMACECADVGMFVKNKLGIRSNWEKQLHNRPKRLRDLKVGDEICFGIEGNWVPGDINTWGTINHVAFIGEVYDDRIIIYDGAYMIENDKNYKVTIMLPKEDSLEAERNVLRKVYGPRGNNWGARRWFDLEDH